MRLFILIVLLVTITVEAQGTCGTIPVSQWGGSPLMREEILPGPVNIVVIQHTATPECKSDDQCQRIVTAIRDNHRKRGFTDVGPSFLIGGNGKVYEGAGWNYVGAHTHGYNRMAIGITFIGDFTYCLPTPLAQRALRSLLTCGVRNRYLTDGYHMVAHSQLSSTISPGDMLRKQVELWPHWLEHAEILN